MHCGWAQCAFVANDRHIISEISPIFVDPQFGIRYHTGRRNWIYTLENDVKDIKKTKTGKKGFEKSEEK